MTSEIRVHVREREEGVRADVFLAERLEGFSRSSVQKLMESGSILLCGKKVNANHKTREGDIFSIYPPEAEPLDAEPENIPLDIVYQDSDIAIVNKPAGMVVHPAKGHYKGTLVNALLYHLRDLSGIGGKLRPGIVHRLDKDTSGLMAVAKNDHAHVSLSEQLKERKMGREYLAVVRGVPKQNSATIEKPIGRHPTHRKKISVNTDHPREAVTEYRVLERFGEHSLLAVKLRTGRTHQIRVHLSSIGYPVLGDETYGKKRSGLIGRTALHAARLSLLHPSDGRKMDFEAPLPDDFRKLLEKLRAGG